MQGSWAKAIQFRLKNVRKRKKRWNHSGCKAVLNVGALQTAIWAHGWKQHGSAYKEIAFLPVRTPLPIWHAHIASKRYRVHHVANVLTTNLENTINGFNDGHVISWNTFRKEMFLHIILHNEAWSVSQIARYIIMIFPVAIGESEVVF